MNPLKFGIVYALSDGVEIYIGSVIEDNCDDADAMANRRLTKHQADAVCDPHIDSQLYEYMREIKPINFSIEILEEVYFDDVQSLIDIENEYTNTMGTLDNNKEPELEEKVTKPKIWCNACDKDISPGRMAKHVISAKHLKNAASE